MPFFFLPPPHVGLDTASQQGRPSHVTPGWKNVGARGMDGVASGASLGWGMHPYSLGHVPTDSNGSSPCSGSSLQGGTRAQPEQ